ncbi:NAPDH dehydrogenase (old yellow enzyme), isoform 2 [Scheffersomyces stipitis CBS 6054]|uniref:Probable NADPH dehydrogenase n=1 Tax=Scheffersomyces stipitis (strain ATCC 58785 / CBS 6054 / NBRC 10063 / NRRL Y-11545) TaxID=322104 RepID=A3LV13_PICST|nr:NAPDH dehydrogenase (old yellow enzyme), isoform 2 [Scheffersomyces stipitis CBS 6054]ABN67048.2 NAPDH dehydrogenase (old yellow enzyme), isoform 2 [Scheffersomyces stipitis CBS 6054]
MPANRALATTKLFKPLRVGTNELSHRVVFAPTTRVRASDDHTPTDLMLQHYDERSRFAGTLVIVEATFPTDKGALDVHIPGLWSKEHIVAWKRINDKIHANKSFSSVQLWMLGRVADPAVLKRRHLPYVGVSPIYHSEEARKIAHQSGNLLREYTQDELHQLIYESFANSARSAIEAGFDYVEVHCAYGYLGDQFLQPCSNQRTDEYGGSIENRARFVLELIDHLVSVVGAHRLAIRVSPWGKGQGMKGADDVVHPITTFSYLLNELQKRANFGHELAYVSLVEPRGPPPKDPLEVYQLPSNAFASKIWKGVFVKANYTYDAPNFEALQRDIEDDRTLVGFSRYFTSNPDLVERLRDGLQLAEYDEDTFYQWNNWGYNTWNEHGHRRHYDEEKEKKRVPKIIK